MNVGNSMSSLINSMSRESLMSIASKVERLAGQDLRQLPTPGTNFGSLSEEDLLMGEIREAIGRYAPQEPHNPRGRVGITPPEITAMRRARHEAGLIPNVAPGQSIGQFSFNPETREVRVYNNVQEWRDSMFRRQREGDMELVSQLMERINAIRETDTQAGSGVNITV